MNNSVENGGAVWSERSKVFRCEFRGNNASNDGGALYQIKGSSVRDSVFRGNAARNHGGAIYREWGCDVENCTFSGNGADYGCDDVCTEHVYLTGEASSQATSVEDFVITDIKAIVESEGVSDACGNPVLLLILALFGWVFKKIRF